MSCFSSLYSKLFGQSLSRSARLKQNVAVSLLVKVGSILCSLVMVPVAIDFVNDVQYGIWLTISSIVAWMSFFDIGFTNGLRNKLAEAFAFKDNGLAKIYVSTTYFILSVIFFFLALLLLLLVQIFDVSSLLNISSGYEAELKVSLSILIVYFCVTFVLRILSIVVIADQRPAYSSFIDFLGQLLSLAAILIFRNHVDGSLTVLSYCLCLCHSDCCSHSVPDGQHSHRPPLFDGGGYAIQHSLQVLQRALYVFHDSPPAVLVCCDGCVCQRGFRLD